MDNNIKAWIGVCLSWAIIGFNRSMNCDECGVFRDSVLINFEDRILCSLVKWGRKEKARLEHELLWKVYSAQIKQDGG